MRRTTSGLVAIGIAMVTGGCEIALPLLIAEATKTSEPEPLPTTSDVLAIELEDISGEIEGVTLAPPMISSATGTRVGDLVQVSLLTSEGLSITVEVCDQAESGGGDPYAGLGGGSGRGFPSDTGVPDGQDAGLRPLPSPCGVGPATVVACGVTCTSAAASDIDALVETEADARQLELDAALEGGGTVHVALRYRPGI